MHLTFALGNVSHCVFIFTKRSVRNHETLVNLEPDVACSTLRSSKLCIIDYFLIASNCLLMLYLRRSQINVPMRPPFRETLPALKLQQKV